MQDNILWTCTITHRYTALHTEMHVYPDVAMQRCYRQLTEHNSYTADQIAAMTLRIARYHIVLGEIPFTPIYAPYPIEHTTQGVQTMIENIPPPQCAQCGGAYNDTHVVDDLPYCDDCACACEHCPDSILRNDAIECDGDLICQACADSETTICDGCGDRAYTDNCSSDDRHTYCESCMEERFTCCSCDRIVSSDYGIYEQDEMYCESCHSDRFTCCNSCDETITRDNAYYCESDGEVYCENCYPGDDDDRPDLSWYNPPIRFYDAPRARNNARILHLGMELEMEFKDADKEDCVDILRARYNDLSLFWCKPDGSLSNGVECCAQPITLDYYQAHPDILDRFDRVRRNGCRAYNTDTAGIHIHTPKDAWTELAVYKALRFFDCNSGFILDISRRNIDRLNQWASIDSTGLAMKAKTKHGYNRYQAINLTNQHTIEFRIFRSTLHVPSIMRNLEFIDCLHAFCHSPIGCKQLVKERFVDFTHASKKRYPNLHSFINRKNDTEEQNA